MNPPGKLITVEGIEGAGKSSNLTFIRTWLESRNIEVLFTREPGGTPLGEDLRRLLLEHRQEKMSDATELLLIFAARAAHLEAKIRPALQRGAWVLCDRFTDATYAYQGGGRGLPRDSIAMLEQWVQGPLRPDLTLLLDLPVSQGLQRAGRRSAPDRFEREEAHFFEQVRQAYLEIAHNEPRRVVVVDAGVSMERVQRAIEQVLQRFLTSGGAE